MSAEGAAGTAWDGEAMGNGTGDMVVRYGVHRGAVVSLPVDASWREAMWGWDQAVVGELKARSSWPILSRSWLLLPVQRDGWETPCP